MAEYFKTKVFYLTTTDWGRDYETAAYAECEIAFLHGVIVRFWYLLNDGLMGAWWDLVGNMYLRYDRIHKNVEFIIIPDGGDPFVGHEWMAQEGEYFDWEALDEAAREGDTERAFYALRKVTANFLHLVPPTPAARWRIGARIAHEDPLRGDLLDDLIEAHGLQDLPPVDDENDESEESDGEEDSGAEDLDDGIEYTASAPLDDIALRCTCPLCSMQDLLIRDEERSEGML